MYNSDYCKVSHLKAQNAILCKWKQFCKGDDYRKPLLYAKGEIAKHNITTWITDTTHGFESDKADTKWLLEEFVPMMIESNIEKIIFIIANDSPLMEEIRGQEVALREYFEVELVEDLHKISCKYCHHILKKVDCAKQEENDDYDFSIHEVISFVLWIISFFIHSYKDKLEKHKFKTTCVNKDCIGYLDGCYVNKYMTKYEVKIF